MTRGACNDEECQTVSPVRPFIERPHETARNKGPEQDFADNSFYGDAMNGGRRVAASFLCEREPLRFVFISQNKSAFPVGLLFEVMRVYRADFCSRSKAIWPGLHEACGTERSTWRKITPRKTISGPAKNLGFMGPQQTSNGQAYAENSS